MNTKPYWTEGVRIPEHSCLAADIETEVAVIGGGIAGLSTAHLLARAGFKVVLLERDRLGCGDTAHTTAHLTYMTDTRLSDLVKSCGEEMALSSWAAGRRAMEHIRATASSLATDVELREVPGYLVAEEGADTDKEISRLKDECRLAVDAGFEVAYLDTVAPTGRPGLRFERQLKFHPLKYIKALTEECERLGVRIFENSNVEEFGQEPPHLKANGHRVIYQHVIIATHVPLQGNSSTVGAALFQTKLASYSTYAVAARVAPGSLPEMIWSDTAEPFHYVRIDRTLEGDVVVLGGEDHKTGQVTETGECFSRLEKYLERWSPGAEVVNRWSGQVVETVDGLPYIGANSNGEFLATGFSGNGMTFGVVAALMARDHISGQKNGWEDTFALSRKEIASAVDYIRENSDFPCRMVRDRIGIDEGNPENIGPGEGRVIKVEGTTMAVCRDSDGHLHRLSAVCPHMGCIVAWNDGEKTWDCPCHGSRFAADGAVIAGPAEEDLEEVRTGSGD